jgi:hypothetical protein
LFQYPSLVKEGNCPDGYDVHYPFLFYETIWNTYAFAGEDGQFVLSFGDPVGTGYHGDFMMGWESQDFLQQALDECQNGSGEISDCSLFNIQSDAIAAQCTFETPECLKDDDVFGPRYGLPVDIPIQYGPANATTYPVAGQLGVATSSLVASTSAYTAPTVEYTSAAASLTSTAQGGIVVDKVSISKNSSSSPTSQATITSAPASETTPNIIATSFITCSNEVVEMAIEQVDVTVTVTPSAGAYAMHKRHAHQHHHRRH